MKRLAQIAPTEFDVPERYYDDPRGRYISTWNALVKPRKVSELQELLRYANDEKLSVVPYGGGTGLVGGQCFPDARGAICLSLEHFNNIDVNADNVSVGAGVVLDQLHHVLAGTSRHFPLHLASSGSAQIGGLISTNAGGVNVIRWGNMGKLVMGLQAVLADGRIVDGTGDLRKDNTGYQLDRMMIGAEGTLGVVTSARLQTFARDQSRAVVMAAVETPNLALEFLRVLQSCPAEVSAFELISGVGLGFRLEAGFKPSPIGVPEWSVLIDLGGTYDAIDETLSKITSSLPDAVLAQNEKQAAELWHIRETIPLANRHVGAIASHDIALPIERVPEFVREMDHKLTQFDVKINAFGHLGDGNLHYNLFPQSARNKGEYDSAVLSELVHQMVGDMGGSISAEHGIGRYKADMMTRYGLSDKLEIMRDLKRAIDPNRILNPGVFFSEI